MTPFPHPSLRLLNGRVDSLSLSQALSFVEEKIRCGDFLQIITVNSLMLLETEKDAELAEVFNSAEMVVADSVGIILAARLHGFRIQERIPGIDLIFSLCELAEKKGWKIFLLGSLPGIAEGGGKMLKNRFPNLFVCGCAHGYFSAREEEMLLKEMKEKKPQLIFVGLGSPHQEKWIHQRLSTLWQRGSGMCAMGIGGSLDVISGRLPRAPIWMRRMGLEWLFRFLQEPWRWRRILKLFLFFYKVLRQASLSYLLKREVRFRKIMK